MYLAGSGDLKVFTLICGEQEHFVMMFSSFFM